MSKVFIRQALFSAGVLLATSGTVIGQQREAVRPTLPIGPPVAETGPDYHHASTAMQGYLDGLGRWLRSIGLLRYNTALAMRHRQAARQHSLENRVLEVDVHFERIRRNRAHRHDLRPSNRSANRSTKGPSNGSTRGAETRPKPIPRLSAAELNRETGAIAWPNPLRADRFAAHRTHLERLFTARRYSETGVGSRNHLAVKAAIRDARGTLAQCIRQRQLDYDGYTVARIFLERLDNEARL